MSGIRGALCAKLARRVTARSYARPLFTAWRISLMSGVAAHLIFNGKFFPLQGGDVETIR